MNVLSSLFVLVILAGLGNGYVPRIIPPNYDSDVRPLYHEGVPLKVFFSIRINGIQEVNLNQMTVKVNLFLQVSWVDERLEFPYSELNNTNNKGQSLSLRSDFLNGIWKPDHYFRLISSIKAFKFLQNFVDVKFYPSRKILTSSKYVLDFECPMNFRYYPFDTQVCEILIGSYFHSINEVRFIWEDDSAFKVNEEIGEQLADYEYSLIRHNETVCTNEGRYPETTACIRMVLELRRYYRIYILTLYFPTSVMVIVGWLSFFFPPEIVPGRATLVIRALLMASYLFFASRFNSPITSYPNALDTWMFFTMITGIFPIFQYAVVLECLKMKKLALNTKIDPSATSPDLKVKDIIRYEYYKNITELVGQIGLPVVFILFNFCYWPIYL